MNEFRLAGLPSTAAKEGIVHDALEWALMIVPPQSDVGEQ